MNNRTSVPFSTWLIGPHYTDFEFCASLTKLIRMLRSVRLRCLRCLFSWCKAKYIWDNVTRTSRATPGVHSLGNLNMRLTFRIRIILRILTEPLFCLSARYDVTQDTGNRPYKL